MKAQTDTVILVVIDQISKARAGFGHRKLSKICRMSNWTIIRGLVRLEALGRLRVIRKPGTAQHQYEVLEPPTSFELSATLMYLSIKTGQPFSLEMLKAEATGEA